MRRSCSPERTERADFSAVEAESTEDLFLAPRQVRSDAAQASRHLECSHLEVRAGFVPVLEETIGNVVSHAVIVTHQSP
jgi:hypothetical protein